MKSLELGSAVFSFVGRCCDFYIKDLSKFWAQLLLLSFVHLHPRTLEPAYEVIAGTVHEGPHFLISLFSPPYMLFLAFFYKIGIYDPDLA
jgi:hypothetical protein